MNYTITLTLSTDAQSDEHLHDEQAIKDEIQSWFESLRATVLAISVRQGGKER